MTVYSNLSKTGIFWKYPITFKRTRRFWIIGKTSYQDKIVPYLLVFDIPQLKHNEMADIFNFCN